ncbi:TIGR04282 family arsenosugar biosynthesis glycosyltransferase [Oceanimonas sp. CHS3-5]|uniref:TIGR04282 family arsenosugar biosynthesis glycosyltransferase n=1 Tax=Oceanimonas sp. CHS3-5 TaxID=3068186 RepID=UPI00273EB78F|nr:TIGR04282 family arsenosugar biosynthesis glycosyltransferase [Oceanimonas sp. CHS3-5]MDP5291734.1 TIGR04282 family arsenosugar biosynthesis glycosyltransferase [Oceanimonas sp. CHS3-5]
MTTRLLIFAKAPLPGQAKTRLIPALGAEGAARLAHTMLNSTLAHALAADIGPVELCMSPAPTHSDWRAFHLPAGLEPSGQGEGNLGARMARAARRGLTQNEAVLLVGTDCPQLCPALLQRAATRLAGYDALLHATADGGYALLGQRRFSAALFDNMPWSTDRVAELTRQRLDALGWHWCEGETLQDIDEPGDLFLLPGRWL